MASESPKKYNMAINFHATDDGFEPIGFNFRCSECGRLFKDDDVPAIGAIDYCDTCWYCDWEHRDRWLAHDDSSPESSDRDDYPDDADYDFMTDMAEIAYLRSDRVDCICRVCHRDFTCTRYGICHDTLTCPRCDPTIHEEGIEFWVEEEDEEDADYDDEDESDSPPDNHSLDVASFILAAPAA